MAIKNLEAKDVAKPIKTGNGWHILKVIEKNTVEDQVIINHIYAKKIDNALKKGIAKIRKQTSIEYK